MEHEDQLVFVCGLAILVVVGFISAYSLFRQRPQSYAADVRTPRSEEDVALDQAARAEARLAAIRRANKFSTTKPALRRKDKASHARKTEKDKAHPPQGVSTPRSEDDLARDEATREQATLAAIKRAEQSAGKPFKRKSPLSRNTTKKKVSKLPNETEAPDKPPNTNSFCKPVGTGYAYLGTGHGVLAEEGVTRYYCIPELFRVEEVARMFKQLAREFAPIIKRREYLVYSVSEMCCCGNGLDMNELGGHMKRVQDGEKIDGTEQHECGGYNTTTFGRRGKSSHRIHLRVRHPHNHNVVHHYGTLVDTMCHELAHCVHDNHSPAFFELMEEIKQERSSVVSGTHRQQYGSESTGDFDIYGSSSGAYCR